MQDPQHDIKKVLGLLIPPVSPDIQQGAVNKYFTENATYRSPLLYIPSAPLSREEVLGTYQWHQVMSHENEIAVTGVVFDEDSATLYVELKQLSTMRFSPFKPTPFNFLIRFRLVRVEEEYKITSQEDFFHPEEALKRLFPPFIAPLRLALLAASYIMVLCAKIAQVLGYWRVGDGSTRKKSLAGNDGNGVAKGGQANGAWQMSKNGKHN